MSNFFGPILGTIVVVLLQSGVSLLSNAWLLYVGVLFIVMVMYAPGGLIAADNISSAPDYVKAVTTDPRLDTVFFGRFAITMKKR